MSAVMIDVRIGFQSASYKTDIYSSAGGQTDGRTDGRFFLMDFQEHAGSYGKRHCRF
jgi:hypothetical protein